MKRLHPIVKVAVMALAIGVLAPGLHGQDGALRYRWTKGQALRYRTIQESNVSMTGVPGAGEMSVTTKVTEEHLMTPSDVAADGTATVNVTFELMKLEIGTPMGNMSVDSGAAGPPADPSLADAQKLLQAIVGESVTMVMAPTGAVKSVDGMSRIGAKVKGTITPGSPAASMLQGLDAMLSDEAFKGAIGQSFANLPDKAVKPGETWQSTLTMPNPLGAMTSTNTFTAKGIERVDGKDLTRVGIGQRVKVAPGGSIGPMSVAVGEGTGEGDMFIDHQLGQIVRSTVHLTLPMTMSMSAPDGTQLSINGVTTTNVTMTLQR